jgi:hypothetical protein
METVFFLSVCGYQVTVKGIIANHLENCGIEIEIDGVEHCLTRSGMSYKVLIKKLPSGLVHALVLPKLALPKNDEENENSFFVITNEDRDILTLFYRHLDEKTEIPLHPSWISWLWSTFEEQDDWLVELKTLVGDFKGYLFYFHPTQLHDLISKAIRKRTPEVVKCMSWKGENGDGTIALA